MNRRERRRAVFAALAGAAALALAGCASQGGIGPERALYGTPAGTATGWPERNAWDAWGDTQLSALIARALAEQPSLKTVLARVEQARAAVTLAADARRPHFTASEQSTNERLTENGVFPPPLGGATHWTSTLQVAGSWELDVFGRQAAALASAIGSQRAAEAEAQAARVMLAANVASLYVTLAGAVENVALATRTRDQRQQVLDLVRERVGAGIDSAVDQRQAELLVAQASVEIDAAHEQTERARHALAELCGAPPDAFATLSPTLAPVRSVELPSELPADLVGRRADLVAQRWRVEASLSDVEIARADFYPNINLAGAIGISALGLDRLFEMGSRQYSVGPAVSLPIFDGERLRANLKRRSLDVDIAVDGYNAALTRALREVADEVSSLKSLERQQRAQQAATAAAQGSLDLGLERYRAGLGNFLVVLTAETDVLTQQRNELNLKVRHLNSEAALSRALGGGFGADAGSTAMLTNPQRVRR